MMSFAFICITSIISTTAFAFVRNHRTTYIYSAGVHHEDNMKLFNHNSRIATSTELSEDSFKKRHDKSSNFDRMKNMEIRLTQLEKEAPETLFGFYESMFKSFSVKPGKSKRFSVTTTLLSLLAILSASDPNIYSSKIQLDMKHPFLSSSSSMNVVQLGDIVNATLYADWREEDLLQVPLIIHTILTIDKDRILLDPKLIDEVLAERMRRLISALFSARPLRRNGQYQPLSDYIIFLCAQALNTILKASPPVINLPTTDWDTHRNVLDDMNGSMSDNYVSIGKLPMKALPDGTASLLSISLNRCAEVSFNELCRQLAFRIAGDRTNFDPIRLAYCLLTYVTTTSALTGTAGIEIVPGEGPSVGTSPILRNDKLVKEALTVFFMEQREDGMWEQGQPIYKSFRRTGRNVGNAYVYAVDTLASLFGALPAEYFRPHLGAMDKTLSWIESQQCVDMIPNYCDPESMQCYGKALRGWSSPHLTPDIGVQGWSTAQTITCISNMRRVLAELMHDDVLEEFGGKKNDEPVVYSWERLLNSDIGTSSSPNVQTLKEVINDRVIVPFSQTGDPSFGAAYSAILFGPPGTAKTTICEALSEKMGWDFLVIDTATFLADGLTNVAARIRYVFDRLLFLRQCVILFDEIEEFCLDRETPGLGMESRMLTTAMLTAINDLRRKKKSIFFLATNRLRAFDAAITRPGRFDLSLFVGTPNLEAKMKLFSNALASIAVDETSKSSAERSYQEYLQSVWEEDAMFMNYLEGLQFASACAKVVASGSSLSHEVLSTLMKSQSAVMTLRSSLRDEYKATMNLSRL